MLMLSAKIINLPVLGLRTGGKIAQTIGPVINPHNLKILGWWCNSALSKEPVVLLVEDVREISARGLVVDDSDALSVPEDLTRQKEVLNIKFDLIGKPVKTKDRKLGKVSDYSFNDDMFIQKIYVTRPLVNVFSSDSTLIIDRTQIQEVTDHYILVSEADIKEASPALATEPVTG